MLEHREPAHRRRGVVLTERGYARLESGRDRAAYGRRLTIDDLSALADLDTCTVSRALGRRRGVDRATIALLFSALGLSAEASDFAYVTPQRRAPKARDVVLELHFHFNVRL